MTTRRRDDAAAPRASRIRLTRSGNDSSRYNMPRASCLTPLLDTGRKRLKSLLYASRLLPRASSFYSVPIASRDFAELTSANPRQRL